MRLPLCTLPPLLAFLVIVPTVLCSREDKQNYSKRSNCSVLNARKERNRVTGQIITQDWTQSGGLGGFSEEPS